MGDPFSGSPRSSRASTGKNIAEAKFFHVEPDYGGRLSAESYIPAESRFEGNEAVRGCRWQIQVEEELFYPWLRENLDEEDMEMLEEAYVEHAGAKDRIAQIEAASEVDATFDAKVRVLGEYIKHHVEEEEEEIFPEVRGEKEALDELGQEMHGRKAELTEELGLEADAPPPGARAKGSKAAEQRCSR